MAYSERELLARIIQCEAGGEGDNGMRAVATDLKYLKTYGNIKKRKIQLFLSTSNPFPYQRRHFANDRCPFGDARR